MMSGTRSRWRYLRKAPPTAWKCCIGIRLWPLFQPNRRRVLRHCPDASARQPLRILEVGSRTAAPPRGCRELDAFRHWSTIHRYLALFARHASGNSPTMILKYAAGCSKRGAVGFPGTVYNLIVAANVIRATAISPRSIVAPPARAGGRLLMREIAGHACLTSFWPARSPLQDLDAREGESPHHRSVATTVPPRRIQQSGIAIRRMAARRDSRHLILATLPVRRLAP